VGDRGCGFRGLSASFCSSGGNAAGAVRWPHEIAGLVLAAESNADLQAATGLDYLQVAEKHFTALSAEPSSEDLWRALYRVRGMRDRSGNEDGRGPGRAAAWAGRRWAQGSSQRRPGGARVVHTRPQRSGHPLGGDVSTRSRVLERVASEIRSILGPGVTRVAVDGVDGAGKTCFASELASHFSGVEVIRSSVDGFHNPRAVRYARGKASPEGFFLDSFDYPLLKSHLLDPLSPGGSGRYRIAAFDHRSDRAIDSPLLTAAPPSILIFDGIFAHRPEIVGYWDYSIFLAVDRRESLRRCNQRDGVRDGVDDPDAELHRRYTKGQELYLHSCSPQGAASIVINNDDLGAPYVSADRRCQS
jgi:uridine kinase